MDRDDPPPGYDDLMPELPPGVKPRSKSPFLFDNEKPRSGSPFEMELHPLVGPPEPTATAPFLTNIGGEFPGIPSLNEVMEEIPNLISIKDGPPSANLDQQEEFLIRDSVESLVGKGIVKKVAGNFQHIAFQSVDGQIFLHIDFSGNKILVIHRNTFIGGIQMVRDTPNSVTLTRSYENLTYTLNHLSPNDIVICRDGTHGHICKLHIPGVTRFDCTLLYSDRNGVTAIEKCLCLAVALVYMAARNDIRTVVAQEEANKAQGLLCLFCVAAVVGIIILVIVIMNGPKSRKKYG